MNQTETIKQRLNDLAESDYRDFTLKLTPNAGNVLGVRNPILRQIAKELASGDFHAYLDQDTDESYEEVMLRGMLIGAAKMPLEERLGYIQSFVPKINNWAVCDSFSSGLKFVSKNRDVVWEFIQPYLTSDKEFEVRFGLVILMDYYCLPEYVNLVLQSINSIQHEGYYVKMAVAWALSVFFIKIPDKTLPFLQHNQLDDFTFNKALQKITESYRVSNEDKAMIRKMKRKTSC